MISLFRCFTMIALIVCVSPAVAQISEQKVSKVVNVELAGYVRGIHGANLTLSVDLVGSYKLLFCS